MPTTWSFERARDVAGLWQGTCYRQVTAVERRVIREGLAPLGDGYYYLADHVLWYLTEEIEIQVRYGQAGDLARTLTDARWMMTLSPLLPIPVLGQLCARLAGEIPLRLPGLATVEAMVDERGDISRALQRYQILLLLPTSYYPAMLRGLRELRGGDLEEVERRRLSRWIALLERPPDEKAEC